MQDSQSLREDAYVMGRSAAEYERLAVQARAWDDATRLAISQTGLRSGMSALDVGCGTGAAMRLMAEVVGSRGRVTGIDTDARIGNMALDRLRAEGPDVYAFVEADVSRDPGINGGPFDLVFARLFFFHMSEPVRTLNWLWQWVKPGGALLVMDYDMTVVKSSPPNELFSRAMKIMLDTFIATGKDIEIGWRIPVLFRQSDVGIPDWCGAYGIVEHKSSAGGMLRLVLTSLRKAAIERGVAKASTLDEIDSKLSKIPAGAFFGRWPDMVATLKRKTS